MHEIMNESKKRLASSLRLVPPKREEASFFSFVLKIVLVGFTLQDAAERDTSASSAVVLVDALIT